MTSQEVSSRHQAAVLNRGARRFINCQTKGSNMSANPDAAFYKRADEHINLANNQLKNAELGNVSASMMYALARFNACVSASKFQTGEQMAEARKEAIDYFTTEYRKMLEEHLGDYIANFSKYLELSRKSP
jgi:hypothetical protein